jgi:hypothetical protein
MEKASLVNSKISFGYDPDLEKTWALALQMMIA